MKYMLPGLMILFCAGCIFCNNNENEPRSSKSVELTDEFVILAYSGPPAGEVNIERYLEVAEAGIDVLVPGNGTFTGEQNLNALELAHRAGIRIIPVDMRITPFAISDDVPLDTQIINMVINDYKNHPAFAGYVIRDEPNAKVFPQLKELSNLFREEDPGHEPLINLFPSYGSLTQLGFADYRAYIRNFIETVKPGLLSYDFYALRNGATMYDEWFSDLSIVREETQKVQIPFIVFVQSEGITEGLRVPNRAEILWQVNTALAYGAKGFGWFCYWTPFPDQGFPQVDGAQPPLVESHYNAMIDKGGNRTEVYDFVREANLYLKKAGRGLLEWDNTDVARYEAGKMVGGSSPVVTPAGEDANLVVGTFKKESGLRIVISNSSCEKPALFSLQVASGWKLNEIFTSIDANPVGEKESLLEWSIDPGGSVLIDLEPA